jgi:hypothetical protein
MSYLLHAGPPLQIRYIVISNIFLPYNLVKQYLSPFLQKKVI